MRRFARSGSAATLPLLVIALGLLGLALVGIAIVAALPGSSDPEANAGRPVVVIAAPDPAGEVEPASGAVADLRGLGARYREARESGRTDEAIRLLTLQIASQAPPSPSELVIRGQLRCERGRWRAALSDLDRAEALAPPGATRVHAGLLATRAKVRIMLLDLAGAGEDVDRFLELGLEPAKGLALRGLVLRLGGRADEAIDACRRALSLEELPEARLGLGLAQLDRGDRRAALEMFAEMERRSAASGASAGTAIAAQAWAWIHPRCEDPSFLEGARLLNRLYGRPRGEPLERVVQGAFQCLNGDSRTSVSDFASGGDHWMQYPETGFYYARALRAVGRVAEAERVWRTAVRFRPELAEAFPLEVR